MKLLAFLMQTGGHIAGWRHPRAANNALTDIGYFRKLAQTAERAEDIDAARAEASKRRAEQRLATPSAIDFDAVRARTALLRSIARLEVSRRERPRS